MNGFTVYFFLTLDVLLIVEFHFNFAVGFSLEVDVNSHLPEFSILPEFRFGPAKTLPEALNPKPLRLVKNLSKNSDFVRLVAPSVQS